MCLFKSKDVKCVNSRNERLNNLQIICNGMIVNETVCEYFNLKIARIMRSINEILIYEIETEVVMYLTNYFSMLRLNYV